MGLKVLWTKRAKKNYSKILEYIVSQFGNSSGQKYFERVEKTIFLLQSYPELGTKQIKNLRAIIIYRRTTILYTFNENSLPIINIVDNRQNK